MNDHPSVATVPNSRPSAEPHGRNLPLGHWGGIKASAHWSTMVAVGLFAEVLATSALPSPRPGHGSTAYWLVGLLTAVVFLMTLLMHELGHAWTARRYGIRVRGIQLWLLGGVTELDGPAPTPRAEALIAAAGPAASLGLGAVSLLLARWAGTSTLAGAALLWLAGASLLLGVFNLLPGSPLDGGRLLRALLWAHFDDRDRADHVAARAGRLVGLALIGLGLFALAGGSYAGLWLALVGWFITSAATAERNLGVAQRL